MNPGDRRRLEERILRSAQEGDNTEFERLCREHPEVVRQMAEAAVVPPPASHESETRVVVREGGGSRRVPPGTEPSTHPLHDQETKVRPRQGSTATGVRCARCAAILQVGSVFCGNCGLRLAGAEPLTWSRPGGSRRAPERAAEEDPVTLVDRRVPRPLVYAIREVGGAGQRTAIGQAGVTIGREGADIRLASDRCLGSAHARLTYQGSRLWLEDLTSGNGSYLKLRPGTRLSVADGARLLLGSMVFRVKRTGPAVAPLMAHLEPMAGDREVADVWLVEMLPGGQSGNWYRLGPGSNAIGRGADQDIRLAADLSISRAHCRVVVAGGELVVEEGGDDDVGSTTGTFVEASGFALDVGDAFQVGTTVFEVESADGSS